MNISLQKLLTKIEEEVRQAKSVQKEDVLREKIYSIKILCELILDEHQEKREPSWSTAAKVQPPFVQQSIQQPAAIPQAKRLELDDGANGDSLFDF
ncbi:YwdI family protein [Neobacillus fumarioli]|uniref:YwdI family protein n=1 Tax=Neobacillus fumarioli TaxID=105229 RepID=UPI000830305B|nr:YwdI family protein [Neobacillus fumarioli]